MESRHALRQIILAILAIAILTVALRVPLADMPFERDEGEYAYIAWRMDFNELPYRDWFDQKPPGIFWVYRIALSLPLPPERAVHLVADIFAFLSATVLYLLARRLLGGVWGMVAALLLVALSADPVIEGTTANAELFMLLPLMLATLMFLYLVRNGRGGRLLIFGIGLTCGGAIAFKQVAGAQWLFLLAAYPLISTPDRRRHGVAEITLWSGLGIASLFGLFAVYFYTHAALNDFIYAVFTHNLDYVRSIPLQERLHNFRDALGTLAHSQAVVWLFAIFGLISTWRSRDKEKAVLLTGWMIAGVVGVSASGYFFPHYFQQILPPLCLLAALGAKNLHEAGYLKAAPVWSRATACGLALALLPCYTFYPFLFTYSPQEAMRKLYPEDSFADMPLYGKVINSITRPDDRVFVFGAEPELLFYAQRVSATRYIFLTHLYGPHRDVLQKQQRTAEEVAAAHPAVAVYAPNNLFYAPGAEQYFTHWTTSFFTREFTPTTFVTPDNHRVELLLRSS